MAEDYTRENVAKAQRIIDKIMEGGFLKEALADENMAMKTFHRLLKSERELSRDYALAQEISADILVDEAIQIADSDDDPAKARNRIATRHWTAEKRNRMKYGERIELNVAQTISISAALGKAQERVLRPMRDLDNTEDAQVLENKEQITLPAPDKESSPLVYETKVPDIFS